MVKDLNYHYFYDALAREKILAKLGPELTADLYSCARVLVPEGGPHWLALGEKSCPDLGKKSPRRPLTNIN